MFFVPFFVLTYLCAALAHSGDSTRYDASPYNYTATNSTVIIAFGDDIILSSYDLGTTWNYEFLLDWGGGVVSYSYDSATLLFNSSNKYFMGGVGLIDVTSAGFQGGGSIWIRDPSLPTVTHYPGALDYIDAGWDNNMSYNINSGYGYFFWNDSPGVFVNDTDIPVLLVNRPQQGFYSYDLSTLELTRLKDLSAMPGYAAKNSNGYSTLNYVYTLPQCNLVLSFGHAPTPGCPPVNAIGCGIATSAPYDKVLGVLKNQSVDGADVWNVPSAIPKASYMYPTAMFGDCLNGFGKFLQGRTTGLMATTDGGLTWEQRYLFKPIYPAGNLYANFAPINVTSIYAYVTEASGAQLEYSDNGGYSWTQLYPTLTVPQLQAQMDEMDLTSLYSVYAIDVYDEDNDQPYIFKIVSDLDINYDKGTILRSMDRGQTYDVVYKPRPTSWEGQMVVRGFVVL